MSRRASEEKGATVGYVVKLDSFYADGDRKWVKRQRGAYVFRTGVSDIYPTAKGWAKGHADTFGRPPPGSRIRVVRIVRKGGP